MTRSVRDTFPILSDLSTYLELEKEALLKALFG